MSRTNRRAPRNPSAKASPVRILVVDDSLVARRMVVSLVKGCADLRLAGTACHGAEAVELAGKCHPDLVLMDWQMNVMDGLEATRRLKAQADPPRVIIMTAAGDASAPAAAAAAGADGFLWKSELPERLPALIKRLFSGPGDVTHSQAVKQDTIREKRGETAPQPREEEFRAMFEVATIGMAQADPRTGQWMRVNKKTCAITGYSADELLQLRIADITHPEDRQRDWELLQRVVRGEMPEYRHEKRCVRKDGSVAWVNVNTTVIRDAAGQPRRTIAAIEDITERKQAELRLGESEERFRTLFELAPDGIYLCDSQGRFVDCNQAGEKLLGYSREELIGQSFQALNLLSEPDLQKAMAAFASNTRGGAATPQEYVLNGKSGRRLPVEVRARPVRLRERALVLVIIRDITERKHLEAQLRQAQKLDAIGQLAGGVAHDFNNLLTVMRGNADLLLMEPQQYSPQANECLKHIATAVERGATLTRQLLIFSRAQAMQPEPLVLNDLVRNLIKMLKRLIREDICLECHYADQLPFVQADPGMIEQALLNLVVNARDAMPRGGQLLIATERVSFDAGYARAHPEAREGEFVGLSVSDNGMGIAPEHLGRIFEPFFTTKEPGQGTGLGLATVYGIVKQHRGWIEVSSRTGVGTMFRLLLPSVPPPPKPPVSAVEAGLRGGNETILLVEDDPSVRMITRQMLERFGYRVHEAACAREALEVWGQHAGDIALLLTDIVMPEGVAGRELAERLRTVKPGLKVIFQSGYSADVAGADTALCRRTGDSFLRKSCPTAKLIQTVRRCLDEGPNPPGVPNA